MTNAELKQLTNQLCKKYFNHSVHCPVFFNHRERTSGGAFCHNRLIHDEQYNYIQINPKMLTQYGRGTLIGVIKHELCHYQLWCCDCPCGHNNLFKLMNYRIGGLRFAPAPKRIKTLHIYKCSKCGMTITRFRRINTKHFVCGKDHGHLKLVKTLHNISIKQVRSINKAA